MKKLNRNLIAYSFFAIFVGCSSPQTIIKDKEILIELPIMRDTIKEVRLLRVDTLIMFEKIIETDTLFFIKYDTIKQRIEYKIKPTKPITIKITDTIQVVDTIKVRERDSFWENLKDYVFGIGVGLLMVVVFRVWKIIKN